MPEHPIDSCTNWEVCVFNLRETWQEPSRSWPRQFVLWTELKLPSYPIPGPMVSSIRNPTVQLHEPRESNLYWLHSTWGVCGDGRCGRSADDRPIETSATSLIAPGTRAQHRRVLYFEYSSNDLPNGLEWFE